MNYAATLCFVLLAAYGLASVLLSIAVAVAWSAWLERKSLTSHALLTLSLLPCAGSLFFTLMVVLPAFLINEPKRAAEPVGSLLLIAAAFTLAEIAAGFWRAGRGWMNAVAFLRCQPKRNCLIAGRNIDIIDLPHAMVAVIGILRPRIVAATDVLAACSGEEFQEIVGHEVAHISSNDNLKLLLIIASPDILAWTSVGKALVGRWQAAVEFEADEMAAGPDPRKRIALASALIKVARMSAAKCQLRTLSMPIAVDHVEGRVRRLLAPLPAVPRAACGKMMLAGVLLVALGAMPLYGPVQELIEASVAFGR